MIVVKVGGSLFEWPDLKIRLQRLLHSLAPAPCLVVPGGGGTAELIRGFDRDHGLGPGASHWLALRACTLNAWFLRELLPGAEILSDPGRLQALGILDSHAFLRGDEGRAGCLPHAWAATSDSVAARVAELFGADLLLLKSVSLGPGEGAADWEQAARQGYVDPLFPGVVVRAGLRVRAVNLREWPGA